MFMTVRRVPMFMAVIMTALMQLVRVCIMRVCIVIVFVAVPMMLVRVPIVAGRVLMPMFVGLV